MYNIEGPKFVLRVIPELENQTLAVVHDQDHGRSYDVRYSSTTPITSTIANIRFYDAGSAIEAKRKKTAHYEPKPDFPDVNLTDLPKQAGIPDEGELTLMVNKQGLVPLVSSDLIPE